MSDVTKPRTDRPRAIVDAEPAPSGWSFKTKLTAGAAAAAVVLGFGAREVFSNNDSSPTPESVPSASAPITPGETTTSTEAPTGELKLVDRAPRQFSPDALPMDIADEFAFYDILNADGSLIDMINVYVSELDDNPGRESEVPTDRFTETENSPLARELQAAVKQARAENPDAVDLSFVVCTIATESGSGMNCATTSSIVQDPTKFPGVSSLNIQYYVQTAGGMDPTPRLIDISMADDYRVTQRPTGEIVINQ